MQSYEQLQQVLKFNQNLPVTPDWSASADFLFLISEYCQSVKPAVIVECSSGLTTLTLARCCQLNLSGHVYSLENGELYQQQTLNNLIDFELSDYADVYHAPLEKISIKQDEYDWYQTGCLPELEIDMLVIDGPSGFIQKNSRFPAMPILLNQMANKSCVFLDDAARDDERALVEIWLSEYSELSHEYIETERGCSVIKINKE